ncbi:cytoskeleton-associated protein 4 [Thalassophryne amazonica]|uniref:cytoskeleton-associated protein 4 n=1 Tax=Thalassophryne amazonica TaxID=390379 RepID=UPI001470C299|nr:cytoskeleton-associated protein 4 [Thalassophryne amazonica]
MTAKNRQKSGSGEKSPPSSSPEDAPKKSPKSAGNGLSGPGAQGPPWARSYLGLFVSAVFYVALIGAAGFAAFYVQQIEREVRQNSARREESAQQSAQLRGTMEGVLQQVESLKGAVDGLGSSLRVTQAELEGAVSQTKRGEEDTRRMEEALQKLQNNLLRDLTEGIKEVKEARETDFSSLEKTVEERLAEVSQSITASVAEFTETQGEVQSQMSDLKARLGGIEDPKLIKQELAAIAGVVTEIRTAKHITDASADLLREQIGAVREELQTRNKEVASLSQEVEAMRGVVHETVGSLKQSLSAAEADVQVLKDKTSTLESVVEQASNGVRSVERDVKAASAEAQRNSDDLEARVKASEDSRESLVASVVDITSKVELLLAKYDNHESALEMVTSSLKQELEDVKMSLVELRDNLAVVGDAQDKLVTKDTRLVEDLEKRLTALEDSHDAGGVKPEELESLQSIVAGLEDKSAKLESHEQAISDLQKTLQETMESLAALSGVNQEE